jgi:methylated-DNA-protein-cysteine methyltransferase-like protein
LEWGLLKGLRSQYNALFGANFSKSIVKIIISLIPFGYVFFERTIPMKPFTENVIEIILSIPAGKVATYGQIARLAGSPRAARQVVRALHSMSKKYRLPWHRVINAKGQIALQDDESYNEQRLSLEAEGVEIGLNGVIDLEKYQWKPGY